MTSFTILRIQFLGVYTGRLTKWAVELSEYDISYQPCTAIKSQALADFIADFAPSAQAQANSELLAIATPHTQAGPSQSTVPAT